MKITICGSIAFYDSMLETQRKLEALGHEVKLPPHEIMDDTGKMIPVSEYYTKRKTAGDDETWVWERKAVAISNHFDKVAWSDAILVTNYAKNEIPGYIGGNTLMEMGVAFYLSKPIYLLEEIPEISYREEVLGMKPILLEGDISRIK